MNLNDYQEAARLTAIYPGTLLYPALGLCGEVGELIAACADGLQDEIPKEIGDVLWYMASVAADAGLNLGDVGNQGVFDAWASATTCRADTEPLCIQAGIVAENVKKAFRDNAAVLTDARKSNISWALGRMLFSLAYIASNSGTTLDQCAKDNLAKLQSRANRGVLKGDGDNR